MGRNLTSNQTPGNRHFPLPKQDYLTDIWKEFGESFVSEDDFRKTLALWPVCPNCGQRRSVRCPVCHHESNLYPPADTEFWNGVDEVPGKFTGPLTPPPVSDGKGCGGSCGCESLKKGANTEEKSLSLIRGDSELYPGVRDWRKPFWNFAESDGEPIDAQSDPQNEETGTWEAPKSDEKTPEFILGQKTVSVSNPNYYRRPMETIDLTPGENGIKLSKRGIPLVTCPVCDEPFVPKYAPFCKECGHSFDDTPKGNVEKTTETSPFDHPSKGRMAFVLIALVLLAMAVILYLKNL